MKIFVISLLSSNKRRTSIKRQLDKLNLPFEFINAVAGKSITPTEMEDICNMDIVNKYPQWLNKGAIGCVLSHKKAYDKIIAEELPIAFIIEDDMIIPDDLAIILKGVSENITKNELTLLYYRTKRQIFFSNKGTRNFQNYTLLYPVDIDSIPISACAYVITNSACKSLSPQIIPLQNTADSWRNYYMRGGFEKISVVHPRPVKDGLFKSDIDYVGAYTNRVKSTFSKLINKFEIPLIFNYLKKKRGIREQSMHLFEMSDSESIFS